MRLICLTYFLCLTVILTPAFLTHAAKSQLHVPQLSAENIVLLHMHNDAPFFSELGFLTLSNKLRYASRHFYEVAAHTPSGTHGLWSPAPCNSPNAVPRGSDSTCFVPRRDFAIDARAPTFGKIKLALAACVGRPGYWMLWSDADALVVNQTVPLTSLIDDRYEIALSTDWLMINAGVILFKCTEWTIQFLQRVYAAREFDSATALDQSAFAHFINELPDKADRVGHIPKHRINTYVEEYRPGDFLVHMAGKLYEATTAGATAIAQQFDVLSTVRDVKDIEAFFNTPYLLGTYSGVCTRKDTPDSSCKPGGPDRLRLSEPLAAMSMPNRYRHVGMRYYWLGDWVDVHDVPNWGENRKQFAPNGSRAAYAAGAPRTNTLELDAHDYDEEERQAQGAAMAYLQLMATPADQRAETNVVDDATARGDVVSADNERELNQKDEL